MHTIRSFIAIPLTSDISGQTKRLIRRLSQEDDGIKWVPVDNLHLTLKFLGDVDNTHVHEICQVIRGICQNYEPFELRFGGTGSFPNAEKPRVLYVGIQDPSGALVELVGQLETGLSELGFRPEHRDYTPHLTLGRTASRNRRASEEVIQRLQAEQGIVLGEMIVDTIQLMASFLEKSGPSYQVMDTIEL